MPPKSPANRCTDMPLDLQTLSLFFLVTLAAGGVVWVFVYPILSGERQAEKRMESVARPEASSRGAPQRGSQRTRREEGGGRLKGLEGRQEAQKAPLTM